MSVGTIAPSQEMEGSTWPFGSTEAIAVKEPKRTLLESEEVRSAEALVVDGDSRYRDHVLVPGLVSMGFKRIHVADTAASAERQLRKHPGTAVVVTNSVLRRGEDGLAVCRIARNASVPTVLLTSFDVPGEQVGALVDRLIHKKDTSVLETVEEVWHIASSNGRSI